MLFIIPLLLFGCCTAPPCRLGSHTHDFHLGLRTPFPLGLCTHYFPFGFTHPLFSFGFMHPLIFIWVYAPTIFIWAYAPAIFIWVYAPTIFHLGLCTRRVYAPTIFHMGFMHLLFFVGFMQPAISVWAYAPAIYHLGLCTQYICWGFTHPLLSLGFMNLLFCLVYAPVNFVWVLCDHVILSRFLRTCIVLFCFTHLLSPLRLFIPTPLPRGRHIALRTSYSSYLKL